MFVKVNPHRKKKLLKYVELRGGDTPEIPRDQNNSALCLKSQTGLQQILLTLKVCHFCILQMFDFDLYNLI